jgi:hypothetical protein
MTVVIDLLEPSRNPASVRHLIAMLPQPVPHGARLALVGPSGRSRFAAAPSTYLAGMPDELCKAVA